MCRFQHHWERVTQIRLCSVFKNLVNGFSLSSIVCRILKSSRKLSIQWFKSRPASSKGEWFPPIKRTDRLLTGLFEASHRGMTRRFLAPIISRSRRDFACVHTLPHLKCVKKKKVPKLVLKPIKSSHSIEFGLWVMLNWMTLLPQERKHYVILFWSLSSTPRAQQRSSTNIEFLSSFK